MPNFCAAPNCTRKSTQSDLAFFRFPRDAQRCKLWVENCRRADLEDKTSDQLNKHYRLCAKHFEASMISKSSPYRTVLKDNAIPTIFDLTSHLNNPHSRHRKRIKELTEEELRKIKERRLEASAEQTEPEKDNDVSEGQDCSDANDDLPPLTAEEREVRDYLKSLFEVLVVIGKQNIPLNGHAEEEKKSESFTPSNFQALLEYRINAGDEVLRKRFEMTAVNTEYCSPAQQKQMLEVCESCIREELLQEIRECRFFSLVTDEVVEISGECHLPLLLRFVDQSNDLREEFIGFLPFEGDEETLTERLLFEITEKWEVYHEFWFEEAVNLAAAMEIPVKVPRLYLRKQRPEVGMEIQPESYFKENLTVPVVERVIKELKDVFSENHLKALKWLSLVPAVMGQLKFNTSEENNADIYRNDLPNPDTLPAELHCWRIKWKHRGKEVSLPSTIYDTLQLSEVKFFPNVYSFLKVLCTLPVLKLQNTKSETARKRLKAYLTDTPVSHRSKSLALLNINYDIKHDLDLMVDSYTKLYPEKEKCS
ncbi:hypothetical protein MATL_G00040360 [Megalops atlanticus]|uniref:THAP-type domain-containing protein n=1 Tax=Megalops atlanticus TaxID=7932 RepID=A0A9D3QD25_MEGAT|nr:hypothetical protein MATL_G00040360 [Megalops atlanticus]